MIITDKFIFINYPKTGSTFVRKTIKEIHNKNATSKFWNLLSKKETFYRIYKAPNLRAFNVPDRKDSFNEHGLRNQIPDKYKHLKIYSIKRSIFEILVSIYEYRDWEKTLPFSYKNIKEDYPNYPEISFKEFIEISYKKSFYAGHPKIGENALKIGFVSINLILFFCKEPFKILMNWDHHSISKIKEEINEVVFLKNEVLNNDLYSMLKQAGYKEKDLMFILNQGKINTSKPKTKKYSSYYNEQLIEKIKKSETLYFNIFPEYLINKFQND